MASSSDTVEQLANREYKYGFFTDIETEASPRPERGDSPHDLAKKNEPEWLTDWRLKAYRHWLTMTEPTWAKRCITRRSIIRTIVYFSAAQARKDAPKSLDEVDPKLLETYEKLGIPLRERGRLAGVAVDAIFDSVSVARPSANSCGEGCRFLLLQRGGAEPS